MEVPLSIKKRRPECCITAYHTESSIGPEKEADSERYNQGIFPQSRCNASCGPRFYATRKKFDNNGFTLLDGDISSHPMVTVGLTEVEGECNSCTEEVNAKIATHRSGVTPDKEKSTTTTMKGNEQISPISLHTVPFGNLLHGRS
nr:hypothetical protein CFP56_58305 [Quercus suber]